MIKLTCSIFISSNNFFIIFLTYIKMSKDSSAKYYQNIKERYQKKNKKKRQYSCEWYKNLLEDEKQKLVEYRKKTIKWEKVPYYNYIKK